MRTNRFFRAVLTTVAFLFGATALLAQDVVESKIWTSDEAWSFLKHYQFGDDWKPLLLIENEVEEANKTPETEKAIAEKLAGYLSDDCSLACRQFVCMQLRLVGGAAQVPALASLLSRPEESENARIALESIPGSESLAALRDALETTDGTTRIGAVNSLAKRNDVESLPAIIALTKSDDAATKSAAVYALGKFGQAGLDALQAANFPIDDQIAGQASLNVADELVAAGDVETARTIYEKYSVESAQRGCRKAALLGLLNNAGDAKNATIIEWFLGSDSTKVRLAAARLNELSDDQFSQIAAAQNKLSETAKIAFLEIAAEKEGQAMFDRLVAELESSDPVSQATAVRLLGRLGDPGAVEPLIPLLTARDATVAAAAADALNGFPREIVGPVLIDAMKKNGEEAVAAINLLASMKYYEAIDPMIELAKSLDPAVHEKAIDGLSKLADPDETDLPRLTELYVHAAKNGYRDKAERAIVLVCKNSENAAETIVAAIEKTDGQISDESNIILLPLLGKLGGEFAHRRIRAALESENPQIAGAALRGFCNWPDATYADELWTLASSGAAAVRQMALRAYIRVVTLKSDRPTAETLAMLKKAFDEAKTPDDKTLAIVRASEIRDKATVEWLAGFLDDDSTSQAACASLTKLAHHRELREPNKAIFTPILEKIEKTAKDRSIVEAAKKARLGM